MSKMEFFHGYFDVSDIEVTPEDTDDFYYLEEEYGYHFVKVDGVLYKFWSSDIEVDPYGFSEVAPPSENPQLLLYWYNGGAGIVTGKRYPYSSSR